MRWINYINICRQFYFRVCLIVERSQLSHKVVGILLNSGRIMCEIILILHRVLTANAGRLYLNTVNKELKNSLE